MKLKLNILFIVLSVFLSLLIIAFRLNTVVLPFYWDEAWVYGPAVQEMGKDFCLLPECASDYTRGHPLLFHALGGIWIKVFGASLISTHSFALAITISFQWSLYYIGKKLYSETAGFFLSALVIVQNIVFSQSTSVFPEILLALFICWGFYFYLRNRLISFVLFAAFACLVKEHGIVFIFSVLMWDLLSQIRTNGFMKVFSGESVKRTMLLIAPLIPVSLFFLLQKVQKGYFFLPEHIDLIKMDPQTVIYQFRIAASLLFSETGRLVVTVVTLLLLLVMEKKYSIYLKISAGLLFFLFVKIVSGKWGFADWLLILSGILLLLGIFYILFFSKKELVSYNKDVGLASTFILFYLVFSAFNFYTDRYLTCLIPLFIIVPIGLIHRENKINLPVKAFVYAGLVTCSLVFLINYKGYGDISPRNYLNILIQKDVVNYLDEKKLQDKKILASFIMANNLTNPLAGFVTNDNKFKDVKAKCPTSELPDLITQFSFDTDSCFQEVIRANDYRLLVKFTRGPAIGYIYSGN